MASVLDPLMGAVGWPTLTLAVIACSSVYAYIKWWALPNGPMGIPYFGYYPVLKGNAHLHLTELVKKYGEVFCFRVTGQLYVHLGSHRALREAHVTKAECFTEKSMNYSTLKNFFYDGTSQWEQLRLVWFFTGVFFAIGEPWQEMKKFFVRSMKEFGMGTSTQESVMSHCAQNVVGVLKQTNGKALDILDLFADNCTQVIRQLLFGGEDIDDEDCALLTSSYKTMTEFFSTDKGLVLAGPFARRFIIPYTKGFRESEEAKSKMVSILQKIVKQHEDTFDKDHLRNLVDSYIHKRETFRVKGDPMADLFTEGALIHTLLQLFGDGGFTAGWFTSIIIQELAKYPEVQRRIQSEIDEVVGHERLPNWTDRNDLPYTTASLYEAQRTVESYTIWPSQECVKETTIQGHRIPRGAVTIFNTWAIHHDPRLYKDPDTFDPSRYMSKGDKNAKAELPVPFGVGKRACAGSNMAFVQLFLFVAAVLQNFDLHPVQKVITPGIEEEWKILIRATPRIL